MEYAFDDGDEVFKPKLTFYYAGDGAEEPVDADLSTGTREVVKALIARRRSRIGHADVLNDWRDSTLSDGTEDGCTRSGTSRAMDDSDHSSREHGNTLSRILIEDSDRHNRHPVSVPLTCDSEFFGLLQEDVQKLDKIQVDQQKALTQEVTALSKDMTQLTSPSKFSKTDMYRWRELFDIYLQAQIFFSTREQDHGSRNSVAAKRQLVWFQSEVTKRGLHQGFKMPASLRAFSRFTTINAELLLSLRYQEVNQQAVAKILKSKPVGILLLFMDD